MTRAQHLRADSIGLRIREIRTRKKLSISWVARRAGVCRVHLSNLERGKCSGIAGPGLVWTAAVAEAMGVALDQLVPPMHGGCLGRFEIQRRVK